MIFVFLYFNFMLREGEGEGERAKTLKLGEGKILGRTSWIEEMKISNISIKTLLHQLMCFTKNNKLS